MTVLCAHIGAEQECWNS